MEHKVVKIIHFDATLTTESLALMWFAEPQISCFWMHGVPPTMLTVPTVLIIHEKGNSTIAYFKQ